MLPILSDPGAKKVTFKNDFPYLIWGSQFAKVTCLEDDHFNHRCIIIQNEHYSFNHPFNIFHELLVTKNSNKISYKSFEKDYDKTQAKINNFKFNIHSFLLQNDKYIAVIQGKQYSVYDIKNDKWLIYRNDIFNHPVAEGSRVALAGDDIIIYSLDREIFFYYIADDYVTNPVLVGSYVIGNRYLSYNSHGLCCVEYDKEEKVNINNNDKSNDSVRISYDYTFKLILFGGNQSFLESFRELDINLGININSGGSTSSIQQQVKQVSYSYSYNYNTNQLVPDLLKNDDISSQFKVKQRQIRRNEIVCDNDIQPLFDKSTNGTSFGHEVIYNMKNEAIVVIVGGRWRWGDDRDIYLFNCNTKFFTVANNVK